MEVWDSIRVSSSASSKISFLFDSIYFLQKCSLSNSVFSFSANNFYNISSKGRGLLYQILYILPAHIQWSYSIDNVHSFVHFCRWRNHFWDSELSRYEAQAINHDNCKQDIHRNWCSWNSSQFHYIAQLTCELRHSSLQKI